MKKIIDGFLLAIQFLTVIPYNKEVLFDEDRSRWTVKSFPVIGLISGLFVTLLYVLLVNFTNISSLFLTFFLLFIYLAFSGFLHLDGWMDCSDAFFSYQNKEKRVEIMSDSRVGAFAVISLVFLLGFRFLFMYESLLSSSFHFIFLLFIPIVSRFGLGVFLMKTPLAKQSGMAFAFKKGLSKADFYFYIIAFIILVFIFSLFSTSFIILSVASLLFLFFSKSFVIKHFGGITGDTLGAYVEGKETFLWGIIWLLL
ncbi:adenosylcobinamide-GDP ribazoletransferase [Metabacillus fastidiosus]|uniref:adenosylcobinamide-GDP ribazoletransferase n=1 Tax=Metabacillus fastidiosus TaxID=1458 RepID=UPI003D2E5BA3